MNKPTPAKRLGIIGDVHAEHDRLESALDFLASENVCEILCTGDIVDGRGNPNKSIELLKKHNVKVVAATMIDGCCRTKYATYLTHIPWLSSPN